MQPRDEIRFQVIWSTLIALVEEQARTLMRTAFSPVVRDSGDLSAALFDRRGRMLAQAQTGTPGHVNSTVAAVPQMLAACIIIAVAAVQGLLAFLLYQEA